MRAMVRKQSDSLIVRRISASGIDIGFAIAAKAQWCLVRLAWTSVVGSWLYRPFVVSLSNHNSTDFNFGGKFLDSKGLPRSPDIKNTLSKSGSCGSTGSPRTDGLAPTCQYESQIRRKILSVRACSALDVRAWQSFACGRKKRSRHQCASAQIRSEK